MYDVISMKSTIEEALSKAEAEVRTIFAKALRNIYSANKVPNETTFGNVTICKHTLRAHSDLDDITGAAGFYIILTDYPIENNNCMLSGHENLRAIYRGECGTIRKRIQSHLFNTQYKEDYECRKTDYKNSEKGKGKEFYEPFWPACLKPEPGVNGIDIDNEKYKNSEWLVIVHSMKGSSQEVRQQAELAFDEVFGKPVACRERV